jgi:NAD(P)H-hydrate epimerase
MKVVTSAQMRAIDHDAIERRGVPARQLMENAGRAVARAIAGERDVGGLAVAVAAGPGNNGGDGCVVARELLALGARAVLYLTSPRGRMSRDALAMLESAERAGVPVRDLSGADDVGTHAEALRAADVVVDALLGTGASGEVRGRVREVLDVLAEARGTRVAVDVPSGLCADTGRPLGGTFVPDLTVTLGFAKVGLVGAPGFLRAGRVVVVDIGFPAGIAEAHGVDLELLDEPAVTGMLSRRSPLAHKGTAGHLLLVAGSAGKLGAAVLAAEGAMRSGVGLCTVGVHPALVVALNGRLLEAMVAPVDGPGSLQALCAGKRAVGFGPGLEETPETLALLDRLLREGTMPVVVDASGLNVLAAHLDRLAAAPRRGPVVLTPHPGEAGRLSGVPAQAVQRDRVGWAREFAARHGVFVALKGARTVIAAPDGRAWINPTGNAGMATGGTGDVLLGVVGSLLCQDVPLPEALLAAVYVHGRAGDLAASQHGEMGLLARDVVENLAAVLHGWGL